MGIDRALFLIRGGRQRPDPGHRRRILDFARELCNHPKKKVTLECEECGKVLDSLEVEGDVSEEGA